MSETHYLISDASKRLTWNLVLRYWEEELEMNIPRNEMGHRYYTDFDIRLLSRSRKGKRVSAQGDQGGTCETLDAEENRWHLQIF